MRKKKDLPLVILKALEPFVNLMGERFEVVDPEEHLLRVIDKDPDSVFHFTIEHYEQQSNGSFRLLMDRSPKNSSDNGGYQSWVEISGLSVEFNSWVELLNEYDTVNSFFDDPIIKSFQEEFYTEFEIFDTESDRTPLKTNQILSLDDYLESVGNKLTEIKGEQNSLAIQDIQLDINSLRESLTIRSKKWVVDKLTNIWAKIAKQGTGFIKEFLTESKKELIKQGIKGAIEYVKENGADLLN